MNSLLAAALEHHSAGRAVLPVRENKGPHCGEGWNCWFERPQSESEVRELFSNAAHGLAILLYPASPNIVLDFDGPHSDDAWQKTGIKLIETAKSRTRSGGTSNLSYPGRYLCAQPSPTQGAAGDGRLRLRQVLRRRFAA
jgi:hypothetical protein